LMDIALHPRFAENRLVYLTYHKPAAGAPGTSPSLASSGRCAPQTDGRGADGRGANAPGNAAAQGGAGGRGAAPGPATITLARGRWDGNGLADVKDIFSAAPTGNASRIAFGKDG